MALTREETQVQFSAANSITLSDNNWHWSNAVAFDATDVAAAIQASVDNASTPASGDTVEVRIAYSNGDILGDTGDDYDTEEHAAHLMTLDTYTSNTPGEDPARLTRDISVAPKGFKIGVKAAQGATRNVVARIRLATQRAA